MLRRSLRALSTPSHTVVDGEDRFMKQAIRFIEAWPTPPRTVITYVLLIHFGRFVAIFGQKVI